jgi:hypothetical protein
MNLIQFVGVGVVLSPFFESEVAEGLSSRLNRLAFAQADLRSLKLEQSYDSDISIIHVISYQTTNDDLLAVFTSTKKHFNLGGILFFSILGMIQRY